jgi:hypothetical protein
VAQRLEYRDLRQHHDLVGTAERAANGLKIAIAHRTSVFSAATKGKPVLPGNTCNGHGFLRLMAGSEE